MATNLNVLDKDFVPVALSKVNGALIEQYLATLAASPTLTSNALGTLTKWVAKNGAGQLRAVRVTNANATARYLQIFNLTAAPAAGTAAPTATTFLIPGGTANNPGVLELVGLFLTGGLTFSTGITMVISSTLSTFTDGATAAEHLAYADTI